MHRRRLLTLAAIGCLSPFTSGCRQPIRLKPKSKLHFLSASTQNEYQYSIGGLDGSGRSAFSIASGIRFHSGAFHPADHNLAVVFARRPGTKLLVIDTLSERLLSSIECPKGRHFYGHGCFSSDGAYLYTTENDYQKGVGIIGVWDGRSFSRLGEMDSYGIGPHDIHLLSDGQTLVVANGGIRTHPDYQRRKLNIDSMQSELVYINAGKGTLINRIAIQNRFLSIRHLELADDDQVLIAMQYQGAKKNVVPLVGVQQGDKPIEMLQGSEGELHRMRHYTASICLHAQTGIIGVTCPRGNIVTFWQLSTREWVTTLKIKDAGGITLDHTSNNFVITTGSGQVLQVNPVSFEQHLLYIDETLGWDNHLIRAV